MATTDASTDRDSATSSAARSRSLSVLDRGLYALFSRHADRSRHERDRRRYRAANLPTGFDVFLARVYGTSWLALLLVGVGTTALVAAFPAGFVDDVVAFLQSGLPVLNRVSLPAVPRVSIAIGAGLVAGLLGKWLTVRFGGVYLRWVASARRSSIEQTLPGAVRYLRVLSSGGSDRRSMLATVADQEAYGETAAALRTALNKAELTGSLDEGLDMVARDTPSRDLLAPFLLKFREHANQGGDALVNYLRLEGRMLSNRQARARERTSGFLELLSELFVVLLILPALFVLILTVMSVLSPGLSDAVDTPLGSVPLRSVLVYGSAGFVLAVGAGSALLVETLRPPDHSVQGYDRPDGLLAILRTATDNPASAVVVTLPAACAVALGLWSWGYEPLNVVLFGYAAFGLPVGAVAVRRARLDDAKDREIKDFVHAVSGHVSLGRPFPEAVERVAREVDLGPLQRDVNDLAFTMGLTTSGDAGGATDDVEAAALESFVEQVGTSMAAQTIGLITGALDAGSDTEDVFETLQTEIGRLYDARKQLRSSLLVYVAVGWTTALLVAGMALNPEGVDPAADRWRFYVVTQATMLACGWFAGTASRGRHEALLHSAALVTVAYVVFAGAGML